jgi:hypothetical protein
MKAASASLVIGPSGTAQTGNAGGAGAKKGADGDRIMARYDTMPVRFTPLKRAIAHSMSSRNNE